MPLAEPRILLVQISVDGNAFPAQGGGRALEDASLINCLSFDQLPQRAAFFGSSKWGFKMVERPDDVRAARMPTLTRWTMRSRPPVSLPQRVDPRGQGIRAKRHAGIATSRLSASKKLNCPIVSTNLENHKSDSHKSGKVTTFRKCPYALAP